MNPRWMYRMSFVGAPEQESPTDAVSSFAAKANVSPAVARTFAKISAPENKHLFSAEAAVKAFAHVKLPT